MMHSTSLHSIKEGKADATGTAKGQKLREGTEKEQKASLCTSSKEQRDTRDADGKQKSSPSRGGGQGGLYVPRGVLRAAKKKAWVGCDHPPSRQPAHTFATACKRTLHVSFALARS